MRVRAFIWPREGNIHEPNFENAPSRAISPFLRQMPQVVQHRGFERKIYQPSACLAACAATFVAAILSLNKFSKDSEMSCGAPPSMICLIRSVMPTLRS